MYTVYGTSFGSGAPTWNGVAGSSITVLDACLKDGFTNSVTSITRSGSTATVTTSTAHGYQTGAQTTIAGANEGDYNGTFTITVTGPNTFTYTVPGTPATPATGTVTWKKLAAGWTKPFSGTNKAAYKNAATLTSLYYRVQDDAPASGADSRIVGCEVMTAIDTYSNLFPTAAQLGNGMFIRKSATANATARNWIVVADARTCMYFILTTDLHPDYRRGQRLLRRAVWGVLFTGHQ
jgi:hypothetical protein